MLRVGALLRGGVAGAAVLAMAACGGGGAKPTLKCFPKEAQAWIAKSADKDAKDGGYSTPVAAKMTTIYVDRSASMVGYLNGADNDNRPFQSLLGNLPTLAKIAGTDAQYRAFGRNISEPIAVDNAKQMQSPAYYSCAQAAAGACESAESHLDSVFAMIAGNTDEMAVVITDMWYDNAMDGTGGPSALQQPLTEILSSGRSVAVYGIEAPFKGQLYDIPAGGTSESSVSHAGTHPLFVLVIGAKGDVAELDRQMERSGARVIREGLQSGAIKRSVFTINPATLAPLPAKPVTPGTDAAVRVRPFETYPGLKVQQFALDTSATAPKTAAKPAQWVAPKDSDFLPYSVWQGDLKANVRVWERKGDEPCAPWLDKGYLVEDAAVARTDGAGRYTLNLTKSELSRKMQRPGIYLLSGALSRVSVDSPNAANDWANDWSFAPDEAGAVLGNRKPLFPTLNLTEVMRIMENALRTATERADAAEAGGITGFTVMIKSED